MLNTQGNYHPNNCAVWPQQPSHWQTVPLSSPEILSAHSWLQRRMCIQGHGRSRNDKHIRVCNLSITVPIKNISFLIFKSLLW